MKMPPLIYGTAWKKEQTQELVVKAVTLGFRGIDTACQPKHYYEKGVGDALKILASQGVTRETIFIQTKFTPLSGQDPKQLPYNPQAPLSTQVEQSFATSQNNLGTNYVDSLVLHSPLPAWSQMLEVWRAMEGLYQEGSAKILGISNCYQLPILKALYDAAQIKPSVLQNRFYEETGYDTELRAWCHDKGITYQSFWTLTANPQILASREVRDIAHSHQKTEAQIFFRFLTQIGIVPLTGTRSEIHMKEDLAIFEFGLSESEIDTFMSLMEK